MYLGERFTTEDNGHKSVCQKYSQYVELVKLTSYHLDSDCLNRHFLCDCERIRGVLILSS